MKYGYFRLAAVILSFVVAVPPPGSEAQAPGPSGVRGQQFLKDYSVDQEWFPGIFRPYQGEELPPETMENSPRLRQLIRNGKLELSLADALALALENNLDVAVQRYVMPLAQSDILRTKSGQATRGVPGGLVPGGLSSGALGAGISSGSGAGGVGSAGGITGGGGAVQIGSVGNFDPSLNFNFSWDRVSSPLNTLQVAGVPAVTAYATAYTGTYSQLFPTGTSYSLGLNSLRQSSTQQFLRFNPAVISRFAFAFHQPLLNGFGRLSNERFILVARNNQKVSEQVFRQQVTNTIVRIETLYWETAALQENATVAEQSLAVARQLYEENKIRADIGTLAPLDVVGAESEVAARERDLILAQTNTQLQETALKSALSRTPDPDLDAARVVITDSLPEVRPEDIPDLDTAMAEALENRPDLRQAQINLQNQAIGVRYTAGNLKPSAAVFGLYAGSGLQGNTVTAAAGALDSLSQAFSGTFPEQAGGMTLNVPIRNRSAQADNLRAQLELSQMQTSLQRLRNQIALEVRQAVIGLIQGKAQVEAAHHAVLLTRQTLDAEQKKLGAGVSTAYQVIQRERDLVAAQLAELQSVTGYARALVEMDRVTGRVLERNGIRLSDALTGTVQSLPTPALTLRGSQNGGR